MWMTDVFPNRACESGEEAISIDSGIKVSIKAHARAEPMQFEENWPQKTPFCANAICGGVFWVQFSGVWSMCDPPSSPVLHFAVCDWKTSRFCLIPDEGLPLRIEIKSISRRNKCNIVKHRNTTFIAFISFGKSYQALRCPGDASLMLCTATHTK